MTYSNWQTSTAPIDYVPIEKPIGETVSIFTSSAQGSVPPSSNVASNAGQYILAQDGTWIPQPSFSSGGSNAYEILRPAVLGTSYSAYPPTVTNTAYAYDADTNHATTFAEFECVSQTRINTITDTLTYSTFASRAQTWTAATINVSRAYGYFNDGESNATTGASNRNTSVTIEYSINNGTNWFTLATDISTSIPSTATTSSAALSTTTPTMANILVKLTLVRGGGGQIYDPDTSANLPGSTGDIDLKIYDIWISGTYAGGAGNITCNDLLVTGDATFSGKIKDGTGSAGTSGYVLSSTGTQTLWIPDSVGSGTVTSITTTGANGVTISGGSTQTITTSGTFALALGAITPTSIATGTGSFTGDVEFASSIKSPNASNSPVVIAPDGTGDVHLNADSVRIGDNNADATIATRGTGDLIITTNEGSAVEGIVRLYDGVNGDITLTPNGSGQVKVGTDQVVTLVASQTLTNKTISGSANTLSNIANASLTNSTISGVALGSNLNALTISSPLTGTSYNGSSAVSIGIPVATTSANGYLSSTDWTTFNNKGSGSVTSVAATVPSLLSISGSPITTSGTLAITYSGTALPVANGGTGLTTLTAGYIPYGAGTSAFGSSANLFWDSTNSRLGIGTASPTSKLNVLDGDVRITASGLGNTLFSFNGTTANITVNSTSAPLVFSTNSTEQMRITSAGNLGIGTSTPGSALHVARPSGTSTYLQLLQTSIESWQIGMSASSTALAFLNSGTERMRLTAAGNLGIGTASPSFRLDCVNNVAGLARFSLSNPNAGMTQTDLRIGAGSSTNDIFIGIVGTTSFIDNRSTSGVLVFQQSGTERMRLDTSGNLGIGTASPSNKLDVVGVIRATNGSIIANTGATVNAQFILSDNGTNKWQTYYDASAGSYNIYSTTASSVRLSIDSGGNVGIGVTPSAWGSPRKAIELGYAGSAFYIYPNSSTGLGSNHYVNSSGTNIYSNSGYGAALYNMYSGEHQFYVAGSGTAGNTVSFTQAMTLTSSGNVGIGTTSPNNYAGFKTLTINGTTGAEIDFTTGGSLVGYIYNDSSNLFMGGNTGKSVAFLANASEGMRLTSTGLGIGTASPSYKLDVSGTIHNNNAVFISHGVQGNSSGISFSGVGSNYGRVWEAANDRWALGYAGSFGGASTEVLNWNSSGNVGIGTASPTNKLQVNGVMVGNNAAGSYTKGFGGILTTTSTSTPTGGSSGDFALIY